MGYVAFRRRPQRNVYPKTIGPRPCYTLTCIAASQLRYCHPPFEAAVAYLRSTARSEPLPAAAMSNLARTHLRVLPRSRSELVAGPMLLRFARRTDLRSSATLDHESRQHISMCLLRLVAPALCSHHGHRAPDVLPQYVLMIVLRTCNPVL